jgi:hypothetical protein
MPIRYDRIVKLTVYHYLCQEGTTWTLYRYNNSFLPPFEWIGKLTLENLLHQLNNINAYPPRDRYDFDSLSSRLYRKQDHDDDYIYVSEYRLYSGWQWINTLAHDFDIYTERVIVDSDFQITHYDKKYPGQ